MFLKRADSHKTHQPTAERQRNSRNWLCPIFWIVLNLLAMRFPKMLILNIKTSKINPGERCRRSISIGDICWFYKAALKYLNVIYHFAWIPYWCAYGGIHLNVAVTILWSLDCISLGYSMSSPHMDSIFTILKRSYKWTTEQFEFSPNAPRDQDQPF